MKLKNKILLIFAFISLTLSAQVGINTTVPDDGSILDIESTEKGVFIPKVDISNLNSIAPITGVAATVPALAGAESLLVYNTNATTGKGFYYWSGTAWIAISPAEDGDFYETATTTAPTTITQDVYRTGKVSIGRDATNSKLDVYDTTSADAVEFEVKGTSAGNIAGLFIDYSKTISDAGSHYAMRTYLRGGSGSGPRYGLFNNIQSDAASSSLLYGVRNNVSTTNTVGTYRMYGLYNQVNDIAGANHQIIGTYNATDIGVGQHIGTYNSMTGTEDSNNTGVSNFVSNTGNGIQVAVQNTITGTGTGLHVGVYNNINGSTGDNYGFRNEIDKTAVGKTSYGTYNQLVNGSGTSYAGWFSAVGTGTNYAAVFNDGLVVINESGNDNDFRVEGDTDQNLVYVDASINRVGIGTNLPTDKLEVVGTVKATQLKLTGLPVYSGNAAAVTAGLAVGDVYRTAAGVLMIRY